MNHHRAGIPADSIDSIPLSVSPALSTVSRMTLNFYSIAVTTVQPPEVIAEETEMPEYAVPVPSPSPAHVQTARPSKVYCPICKKEHPLLPCRKFQRMAVEQRLRLVVKAGHCAKCLPHLHSTARCPRKSYCFHCQRDHNTLLHVDEKPKQVHPRSRPQRPSGVLSQSLRCSLQPARNEMVLLMPTCEVFLLYEDRRVPVRAVLDPCSEWSSLSLSSLQLKGINLWELRGQVVDVMVASRHRPRSRESFVARVVDHISLPHAPWRLQSRTRCSTSRWLMICFGIPDQSI